ncbi:hypothetical protein [Micromonospora lupini]|uniref:Uncharacterized protein n=1 Tax=Micromonospora lupini str. Lupac 08 TaxID=1150864 RepID=I0KY19_9ACTN|nr:hypothetical protein [Micromonospora lupini]CCH16466.1 exported hypothetical protein [Micromonospora lupini str. Lupac 08]
MRPRTLLAVVAPVALAPFLVAGVLWWALRPPEAIWHDDAVADATETADRIEARFERDHLYRAADYARTAAQEPDVAVLSVTGETHWQTGVTLVLRVTGHGQGFRGNGHADKGDEVVCFRFKLGPKRDSRDDGVDCPAGDPLPIQKDPTLDGLDGRLKETLGAAGPDEARIRKAVDAVGLDPAVRREFSTEGDTVGVALRASQYDCLLARVDASGAQTWRPSHIQLAPGELPCTAGTALSSQFGHGPR